LIPAEIYQRKKMGFELPMFDWMRGPLHQFTADGLKHVSDRGVLSVSQAAKLHERFNNRKLGWQKLWAFVVLGWYLEKENIVAPSLAQVSHE
jgi:hypothetical protein